MRQTGNLDARTMEGFCFFFLNAQMSTVRGCSIGSRVRDGFFWKFRYLFGSVYFRICVGWKRKNNVSGVSRSCVTMGKKFVRGGFRMCFDVFDGFRGNERD